MMLSYFFANSNNCILTYLQNLINPSSNTDINSLTNTLICGTNYAKDPSSDEYCITTFYGLLFPKSNSAFTYMEGGKLDYQTYQAHYPS